MKPTDILTKELFKAWLVKNQSKRIFRVSKNSYQHGSCPVAKFLKVNGFRNVEVYGESVIWNDVSYRNEQWIKDFIKAFDKYVGFNGWSWNKKSLTGNTVLKILEAIQ